MSEPYRPISLPSRKADRSAICPRCHTFIRKGSRIVRLEEPEEPWTYDGRKCWRTGGYWYYDGRQISTHARAWVHFDCYVEVLVEEEACVYCGGEANTIDHVIPRRYGGSDRLTNLVPACRSCNSRKGTLPVELVGATWQELRDYLLVRGWTPTGTKMGSGSSWRSPDPSERSAFYTRAMAIRCAAYGSRTLTRQPRMMPDQGALFL